MAEYFIPRQCSEREVGGDEDCTWCSGVMLYNAASGRNAVPSTRAEYEALRVAGGDGPAENPGDGSNYGQLEVGLRRRYGWDVRRFGPPGGAHLGFGAFWSTLAPGYGAAVQGSMGAFPRTGHWRRWDRQFGGAHSVFVERLDRSDRVWWMNPSAPNSHAGEWMSKEDLRRYYEGMQGGFIVTKVGALRPPDTSTGDAMELSIPEHLSIATSKRATRLYPAWSAGGGFEGKAVDVAAGVLGRYIGWPRGRSDVVIVGYDRSPSVEGQSGLYGKAADWAVREQP